MKRKATKAAATDPYAEIGKLLDDVFDGKMTIAQGDQRAREIMAKVPMVTRERIRRARKRPSGSPQ